MFFVCWPDFDRFLAAGEDGLGEAKMLENWKDFMVLELVMASERHLKPSIRGVKMMKKQWFLKVFKVLHDFDMKLYDVSGGENVEKQMFF